MRGSLIPSCLRNDLRPLDEMRALFQITLPISHDFGALNGFYSAFQWNVFTGFQHCQELPFYGFRNLHIHWFHR